jgi:hypothetical protein
MVAGWVRRRVVGGCGCGRRGCSSSGGKLKVVAAYVKSICKKNVSKVCKKKIKNRYQGLRDWCSNLKDRLWW